MVRILPPLGARHLLVFLASFPAVPAPLAAQGSSLRGCPPDVLGAHVPLERAARETPDPERIGRYIRAMTAFPHVSGTPGSKRVAEWALARFTEWGLDASIQT